MTDQYISSVSLLLHGNGANNSTTIADSSLSKNTVTAYGDAKISTTQSKFGDSSIYFDGTGDYLAVTSASCCEFLTGDFTIEFWLYKPASGLQILVNTRGNSTNNAGIEIAADANNTIYFWDTVSNTVRSTTNTISLNTWTHIAVSRATNTLKIFIGGTQGYSGTNASSIASTSVIIGRYAGGASYSYTGYLDDIRITKGVGRYTADFTAPTAEFDDPVSPRVYIKRGTRAQLDTAATNTQLMAGEQYLITDESRVAVGLSTSTYSALAKQSEVSKVTRFFMANG